MKFTANDYLDARRPEWIDAEMLGHIRYDKATRLVETSYDAQMIAAEICSRRQTGTEGVL